MRRLNRAVSGEVFDLTDEEEGSRRLAWGLYYFSILFGLVIVIFFPIYSLVAGLLNGALHWLIFCGIPPKIRLLKRYDEEWVKDFKSSEHPDTILNSSIGGTRFIWEYTKLPLIRKVTDAAIIGSMAWPYSIYEVYTVLS